MTSHSHSERRALSSAVAHLVLVRCIRALSNSSGLVVGAFMLAGCATYIDAAPGISGDEMRILVSHFKWSSDSVAPTYTRSQLDAVFQAAADPTARDFGSDAQASRLAVTLASVGDERFAEALARQSKAVRHAVACYISDFWVSHGLHYPKTKALLQPHT